MLDVIICANFGVKKLRGLGNTRGQILEFPIEMAGHLYNRAGATTQPVICCYAVQLVEGKSYCVELTGNISPTVASSAQLGITVRAFRVNRLSFIVKVSDRSLRPDGCLKFLPATKLLHSMEIQHGREPVCCLSVSLAETTAADTVPEEESEDLVRNFAVARQKAG